MAARAINRGRILHDADSKGCASLLCVRLLRASFADIFTDPDIGAGAANRIAGVNGDFIKVITAVFGMNRPGKSKHNAQNAGNEFSAFQHFFHVAAYPSF
jgi:hypothetical protein